MGLVIAVLMFVFMAFLPPITILIAKYISLLEKIVWLGMYILGTIILLKYSSNGGIFLLFTLMLFIIFKITYARRKAIWLEQNNLSIDFRVTRK